MADSDTKSSGKVTFQYGVRIASDFKGGKITYREKGDKVTINATAAEKFVKMGLGKILGSSQPLQVKG